MKKCLLFFIGLILTLALAIMTDGHKTGLQENKLANSDVDAHKNFAENKAAPTQEVWKR
ncbi:hypothetical protein KCTC52924_01181 [Arenibacter antarcticus]|uniref:Uncharacterized protein n=1 Tax=Arenibacter antarcticus TaxID=2040469 RepID=A0ABW5VDJ0_9FLAO|nr:hypothetical protein [Arenibacter sp. H213]